VGRDEEFSEFASHRWLVLTRSAALLGASRHEAEDLAQTTLMQCYLSWSKVTGADNVDAYVYRILLNAYRASHRRRWWGERPTRDLPDTARPDPSADVDTADAVRRSLSRLNQGQREVVVLRYFVHLGEQEIAQVLGIAPGTVKSRLSRGLQQLSTDSHLHELLDGTTP
jgi:RNA polymerase sigma-70 factor (sigma-E family)